MNIDSKKIVSISRANQNFSKVCRLAETEGELYIFKNNQPKFKLIDLEQDTTPEMSDEEKIDFVASRVLKKYRRAFEELAK